MNEMPQTCCRLCGAPLSAGVPGGVCAGCFGGGLFEDEPDGLPFTRIGDYELLEEIGRGGMGLVFRARQISVNRPVAVKLILTGPLASAVERQRFLAEASAAAALEHPGIVAVFEAGEEDGQPFFAMQLVEGESLSARLRGGPRFAPGAAAALIRHIALAVQHAHERGFLHRDLKPGNILLDAAGRPHVTDFGLARRLDDDSHLTLTGTALGTPSYMAPEQTDTRQPPTTAVDIYSLGAIFYELLSGHPPFAEKSLPELFMAIREKEPVSLSGVHSAVDRDLDIICRKCLEKVPAGRYRSAQSLADDLQRWSLGEPITARAVGKTERIWRWCRRRPAVAGLAAAVLLMFFAGLAGILWQWSRANREAAAARAALDRSEESLWSSNVSEARARRISRERGQRVEALRSLQSAAAYRPSPALRNEAIAAMAYPDIGEMEHAVTLPSGARDIVTDRAAARIAYIVEENAVQVQPLDEPGNTIQLPLTALHSFLTDPDMRCFVLFGKKSSPGGPAALWRVENGAAKKILIWEDVTGAAISPDGSTLLLGREGKMEVIDTADGGVKGTADTAFTMLLATISPDGTQAAVFGAQGAGASLWALEPLKKIQSMPEIRGAMLSLAWHPAADGSLVAGVGHEAIRIRTTTGKVDQLASHEREGAVVLAHPVDHYVASTSWDGVVKFSAPGLGQELLRTSGFRPVGFKSDGSVLVIRSGSSVGRCRVSGMEAWRFLTPPAEEEGRWRHLAFSPDSQLLASISRDSLVLTDPVTLRRVLRLPLQQSAWCGWMPDGTLLVSRKKEGLSTLAPGPGGDWSQPIIQPLLSFPSGVPIDAFDIRPDGRAIILCTLGSVGIYDLERKALTGVINSLPMISRPVWSPDGRQVAAGYWNNQTSGGSEAHIFTPDAKVVTKLPAGNCLTAYTPDGARLIIGSTNEYVEWDTATWKEVRRHPRDASGLDQGLTAFCASQNLMALQASETVIRLLRLDTAEELARLEQPSPQKITQMCLSPDGRWLAVQMAGSVRLWNIPAMRRTLRGMGLDWE